jgi:hypothetical protein
VAEPKGGRLSEVDGVRPVTISATYAAPPRTVLQGYRAGERKIYVLWAVLLGEAIVVAALSPTPLWLGVPGIGLVCGALREVQVRRSLRGCLSSAHVVTIEMDDVGLLHRCPGGTFTLPWSACTGARRIGRFWVLRRAGADPVAFPAAALDQVQSTHLSELLQSKGLVPPGDLPVVQRSEVLAG